MIAKQPGIVSDFSVPPSAGGNNVRTIITEFTTSGTYTPDTITTEITVLMIGAGGGGGGGPYGLYYSSGGGGGAVAIFNIAVTLPSYSVVIGVGGTLGSYGITQPTDGTESSFGSYIVGGGGGGRNAAHGYTAPGGAGGIDATGYGSNGGNGGTGSYNQADAGGPSLYEGSISGAAGGGGGSFNSLYGHGGNRNAAGKPGYVCVIAPAVKIDTSPVDEEIINFTDGKILNVKHRFFDVRDWII